MTITLKKCREIPISQLYIAHISMRIPYEKAQGIMKNRNASTIEGFENVNQKLTEIIKSENSELPDYILSDILKFGLVASMTLEQDTVLYKTPDGHYISLNGYGNPLVEESSIKLIEPLENFYLKGTFKFKEFPKTKDEIKKVWETDFEGQRFDKFFAQGIYIDVEDTEPFERFSRKSKS